jgi:hypothetical protein
MSTLISNQALKYRWVTDIVRPIRDIVRRREETTGHILSDLSETEVYCSLLRRGFCWL